MNTNDDTYFVVYNPKNIIYFTDYEPYTEVIPVGYYMAYWVTPEQKMLFKGNYMQCRMILNSLQMFGTN